jgi:hypothetical protein
MTTATAFFDPQPAPAAPLLAHTALTVREPAPLVTVPTPRPIFTGADMGDALTAYLDLQRALDRAMPDQIIELDGKPYRKKGYWRAIRTAFGLTVTRVAEQRAVDGVFADGRDNFGYLITYRATSAAGDSVEGDGSCFAVEKARRFKCPHLERPGSRRTRHFPHDTCPDFDPECSWRTLPAGATVHNIRSHAHTRAFNRAVSNLVAFGEVSAEEMERGEAIAHDAGVTTTDYQKNVITPVIDPPPTGYETWLTALWATAAQGNPAFYAAWNEAPIDFRTQLSRRDTAKWDALKTKAAQATPARVS